MIVVGSLNPAKLAAVSAVLATHPRLAGLPVTGLDAPSGVREQPMSLEETVQGAKYRAWGSLRAPGATIALGIESGVWRPIDAQLVGPNGMLSLCVCVVVGRGFSPLTGFASSWLIPPAVAHFVMAGKTLSEATRLAGLTNEDDIGRAEGLIGILSGGTINRQAYVEEAVRAALLSFGRSA